MVAPSLPAEVSCALVGMSFVPDYPMNVRHWEREMSRRYWEDPDAPDAVVGWLRRNPDNQYDPNAIEVHFGEGEDSILGHLPRNVARKIAPEMDAGIAWSVTMTGVRTHPQNVDNPGVDVRLARGSDLFAPGTATIDDVIRESVGEMPWSEVNYELATRDLEVPKDIEAMRTMLAEVYIQERNEKGIAG
jgi:hypothetical protein